MLIEIVMRLMLAGVAVSTLFIAFAIWIGAHVLDFTAQW